MKVAGQCLLTFWSHANRGVGLGYIGSPYPQKQFSNFCFLFVVIIFTFSLRPMTHETFAADFCCGLLLHNHKLRMCHALLQNLETICAAKVWIGPSSISLQLAADKLNADWSSPVCTSVGRYYIAILIFDDTSIVGVTILFGIAIPVSIEILQRYLRNDLRNFY